VVEHVYLLDCDNINPYHNLAAQNYLFNHIPDNSMVFMVWKNNDSIILGNNLDAYSECNVSALELEHSYLARRDSYGSTVFNDLGCLNFAFFLYLNNYNIENQINVIYQALSQLNLPVYMNVNNEIMLSGGKLTDSNYMTRAEKCMHSVTLYWDCDKSKRSRLLKEKNSKKPITNITDYNPIINYMDIKRRVLQSLADRYGAVYQLTIPEDIEDLVEHYHSYKHIYRTDTRYTILIHDDFEFGQAQFYVDMIRNKIIKIDAYLPEGNEESYEIIHAVFDGLKVDEIYFNKKLENVKPEIKNDLIKLYQAIKKESYNL